jgi:MYXO-CTERM domain-containing protein
MSNLGGGPGFWLGNGDTAGDPSRNVNGDRVFSVTAIPEPSAALLGGLGMLALLRRRRA